MQILGEIDLLYLSQCAWSSCEELSTREKTPEYNNQSRVVIATPTTTLDSDGGGGRGGWGTYNIIIIPEGKKRGNSTSKRMTCEYHSLSPHQQPPEILQWDGLCPVQKACMCSSGGQSHGPLDEVEVGESVTDVSSSSTCHNKMAIRQ
jgi:hypothetical protein